GVGSSRCEASGCRSVQYGTKADVGGAKAVALALARLRTIAHAVILGAQVGAALDDGNGGFLGLGGVETKGVGLLLAVVVTGIEGAGRPLPDVAQQVMQTQAVGIETAHRRAAEVAVTAAVLVGEHALPGVGSV